MTRRIRIYPYKPGSTSARALAQAVGGLRLTHNNSRFRPRATDLIINWGSTNPYAPTNLNSPVFVALATEKTQCLRILSEAGIPVPPFTVDREEAREMAREGRKVVCRTLTRANSGRGIVMADTPDQVVAAPLYTQYIKKQDEYRVHVFNGRVIDVQRKMRRRDVPDDQVNWQVRNHSNGFVFGREGVELPEHVHARAIQAIARLSLDFGAVDIIYNARQNEYYVLEINTAPGLSGTTLERYAEAVNELTI